MHRLVFSLDKELAARRATDQITPDLIFRDPDFLGLADTYSEKDLERAILRGAQRAGAINVSS